jgi:Fur family ferric uptake transcriptional regulator
VTQVGPDAVNALVAALNDTQGFETDVGHLTVFGKCAECRAAGRDTPVPNTATHGTPAPGTAAHGS